MKTVKNTLSLASYATALCFCFSSYSESFGIFSKDMFSSSAHDLKLGGYVNSQYAYIDQKGEFETLTPGSTTQDRLINDGLFTDSEFFLKYAVQLNESSEFGAEITFYSSVGRAKNGSPSNGKLIRIHYQGESGRYEIGEMSGASIELQKSANNIAKGTGGIDGDFDRYENQFTIDGARKDTIFINYPYMPIGSDFNTRRFKVSYYTPQCKGFQFGISFTPDIENSGTAFKNLFLSKTVRPRIGEDLVAYKNIVEGGIAYDKVHSGTRYEFSALTQIGSSKIIPDGVPRDNLRAFELGSVISRNQYSIAGSYGNWGESGTSSIKVPGAKYGAYYYTLGTAYEDDQFGASITYLNSRRAGGSRVFPDGFGIETAVVNEPEYNKLQVFSVGSDYKIVEGLKAYLEYNYFEYDRSETPIDNSGSVYIVGLKLSF